LEIPKPATAIYWLSPFVYRMLGRAMKPSRPGKAANRRAALAAAVVAALGGPAPAQEPAPGSCAVAIRAVLANIAARDLDTSRGPPLNAFFVLNPNAVAQPEALDRKAAAGEATGALFCVPVAVKDNFDTYDMPTAGVSPIHFGIIMAVNLSIGMYTPPFGLNLFASQAIFDTPLGKIYVGVLPFVLINFATLMVITYVPSISMVLLNLTR
jgi:hypothetical protein